MAVDTYALTTRAKMLEYLGIDGDDFPLSAFKVHCDATDATAATVTVTDSTITLVITGGASAGTNALSLTNASYDTLAELATAIEALSGWSAELLGPSAVASTDLVSIAAQSVLGKANELTLDYQANSLLDDIINRASHIIETMFGRNILSRDYREWHNSEEGSPLILNHRPVTAVKRLASGRTDGLTVRGTTTTDLRATVEVQDSQIILSRFDSSGTETPTALAFATYATTSALVTQINLTTGWSATLLSNALSLDLFRAGGQDALGRDVRLSYPSTSDDEYRVDEEKGLVYFTVPSSADWALGGAVYVPRSGYHVGQLVCPAQSILVQYTAGYATTPYGLEEYTLQVAKMILEGREHDSTLQSESLGDYSKTLAKHADVINDIRARVESLGGELR